jgi:hypothetical protein
MLLVAKDPESLTKFYGVLEKVVTDHIKRLLNIPRLRLWEGRVSVIRILDPESAVRRIAYFYANPAKEYLVRTISEYPGVSSYQSFQAAIGRSSIDVVDIQNIPWIRPKYIIPIKSNRLARIEDQQIVNHLVSVSYYANNFETAPNEWMRPFNIANEDAPKWNQAIVRLLADKEEEARKQAIIDKREIVGARALRRSRIFADHIPKKDGKKIFFIGRNLAQHVSSLRRLCLRCTELFWKYARHGMPVRWPPGVFPPRSPVSACALV